MAQRLRTMIRHAAGVLRSSDGAWDVNSIIAGVVVGAILLVSGAVSLFVIVPRSQDSAAKDALEEVRDAQRAALSGEQAYLGKDRLIERGFIPADNSVQVALGYPVTGKRQVKTDAGTELRDVELGGSCYVAMTTSRNGNVFWASDTAQPQQLTTSSKPGCVTSSVFTSLVTALGADPVAVSHSPVHDRPTVIASRSGSTATFEWDATGAAEYKVEYNDGDGWKTLAPGDLPSGWSMSVSAASGGTVRVPAGSYSQATDLAVRVSSVNGDGSYSPTSEVTRGPDGNVVELAGLGNVLLNPGFEEGMKGWKKSDSFAQLTSSDTYDHSVAALRLAHRGWVQSTALDGSDFIEVSDMAGGRVTLRAWAKLAVDVRATVTIATDGGKTVYAEHDLMLEKTAGPLWQEYTYDVLDLPDASDVWVKVTIHGAGSQTAGTWALIDDVAIEVADATVSQLGQIKEMP